MTSETIEPESTGKPAPQGERTKSKHTSTKKARAAKKAGSAKKTAEPKTERANKKAEVIALMKRAKGATSGQAISPAF